MLYATLADMSQKRTHSWPTRTSRPDRKGSGNRSLTKTSASARLAQTHRSGLGTSGSGSSSPAWPCVPRTGVLPKAAAGAAARGSVSERQRTGKAAEVEWAEGAVWAEEAETRMSSRSRRHGSSKSEVTRFRRRRRRRTGSGRQGRLPCRLSRYLSRLRSDQGGHHTSRINLYHMRFHICIFPLSDLELHDNQDTTARVCRFLSVITTWP